MAEQPPPAWAPPPDQFTEEQRAEAYRIESMQQMMRQTRALESMRSMVLFLTILVVVGLVMGVLAIVGAMSSGPVG